MVRSKKVAGLVLAAGLVIGGITAGVASTASASASACGGSGTITTFNGKLSDGATYLIECPAGAWNGTLYLYSHGYVTPGASNPAQDVGDPVGRTILQQQPAQHRLLRFQRMGRDLQRLELGIVRHA